MRIIVSAGVLGLFAMWLTAERLEETFYVPPDHPAIQYYEVPLDNPIAKLDRRLERGEIKLDYAGNGWGYLPSILKALDVPIDSQSLVFSKTSIQAAHISPRTPRAIYFNDEV